VQLQLRTAAGDVLPFTQDQLSQNGHCIEVRIYAENPGSSFLPSVGKLHRWIEPKGPGVRVDSGVEEGDTITPYYDPMLAKLIVHAGSRDQALRRLRTALDEFCVMGIDTNIPFLQAIVDNAIYRGGGATTRLLADCFSNWLPSSEIPEPVLLAMAADSINSREREKQRGASAMASRSTSPWQSTGSWRNS